MDPYSVASIVMTGIAIFIRRKLGDTPCMKSWHVNATTTVRYTEQVRTPSRLHHYFLRRCLGVSSLLHHLRQYHPVTTVGHTLKQCTMAVQHRAGCLCHCQTIGSATASSVTQAAQCRCFALSVLPIQSSCCSTPNPVAILAGLIVLGLGCNCGDGCGAAGLSSVHPLHGSSWSQIPVPRHSCIQAPLLPPP